MGDATPAGSSAGTEKFQPVTGRVPARPVNTVGLQPTVIEVALPKRPEPLVLRIPEILLSAPDFVVLKIPEILLSAPDFVVLKIPEILLGSERPRAARAQPLPTGG